MTATVKPCVRCGHRRPVHESRSTPLCADCKAVVTDLDELDRWVA